MKILQQEISDQLLPAIEHPVRFIGGEHNSCSGDINAAEVSLVLGFPDDYGVGISHLGTQILYSVANSIDGVVADRFYCPDPPVEAVMREKSIEIFGVETRAAISGFDIVGISLCYEMAVTNVLTMLDLAGIPLRSKDRDSRHPLIIAGGTQADNPEPMAEFFDLFLVGDGEQSLTQLIELVRRAKSCDMPREQLLLEAAKTIESAYVPSLWQADYADDGKLLAMKPTRSDIPDKIARARVDLCDSPDINEPLVPNSAVVFDRISLEIMRGCPHGCRFCHAGFTKNPIRRRSIDTIVETAHRAIDATGFREISLLSLSTGDYPDLPQLLKRLADELSPRGVSISVPSLRIDKQLSDLPEQLNKVRKGGMTIAAEVGSQRLREAINKRISSKDLLSAVEAAYRAGWRSVKVYFMAGFPGEDDSDLDGIIDLCRQMSYVRRNVDGHPGSVSASVSWFVPKAHTPLQWAAQADMDYFWHVRDYLKSAVRRTAINFKFHTIERSVLEAVIARGDRRLCDVIEHVWRAGSRYDSWREYFDFDKWQRSFDGLGVDMTHFTAGRSVDDCLSWDHIVPGVPRGALVSQWQHYCQQMSGEADAYA